jgi:hypothetical protein
MNINYYSLPVNIRQTAATASGATVFSMRNSATSTIIVFIERIELLMGFDGTTAVASTPRYDLIRFSGATPTGGTALTVAQMYSGDGATQVADARFLDTGLTTTGLVFNPAFAEIGCPAALGAAAHFTRQDIPLVLGPGEGFCIRTSIATAIGMTIVGEVVWSER